jgi:very-short-patch-repair endonuclease
MYHIPYNKNLREFSKYLRSHSTTSEVLLWQYLKASQMHVYTFNRQKPLGRYIVDFYCRPLNLVIEIDGDSHKIEEVMVNDIVRQEVLESMGLYFLRYDDLDVKFNIGFVLSSIESHVLNPPK